MIQLKQHQKYTSLVIEITKKGGFLTVDNALLDKLDETLKHTQYSKLKALLFHFKANPDKNNQPISIAGGNLKELHQLLETPDLARLFFIRVRKFLNHLMKLDPLIIIACDGSCIGGGAEWLLHCDYSFLSENAYLDFKQLSVGLPFGFGGDKRIIDLCSKTTASQIIFNTQKITAKEAKEINLVHETMTISDKSLYMNFLKKLDTFPIEAIHAQKKNLHDHKLSPELSTNTFMKAWGNETYRNSLLKFQ